jgi:hypothetical protein
MQIKTCRKTHVNCEYPHIKLCKQCPIIKNAIKEQKEFSEFLQEMKPEKVEKTFIAIDPGKDCLYGFNKDKT